MSPALTLPARGAVKETVTGTVYVLAGPSADFFRNGAIRVKYPVTPAQGLFSVGSPAEVLANSFAASQLYLDVNYIRRVVTEEKSFYNSGYEVIFNPYSSVSRGQVFVGGGRYYLAMQDSRTENSGFAVVEAIDIYSPLSTVTITTQGSTYNPVTDTYNSTTYTSVSVFSIDGVLDFEHESLAAHKVEDGDKTIYVRKTTAANLAIGSKIGDYRVISMDDRSTYWACHSRRG